MKHNSIQAFQPEHLDTALRLSQGVSWPHRREDWEMLLSLSEGVVALQNGEVIGTALRTDFAGAISTLNMIIVDESCRGQGLGRRLMEALMPDARSYRLVATAEGLPLYEKLGFVETGRILQHQGQVVVQTSAQDGIRQAVPEDFGAIRALEDAAFGGGRAALMDWLFDNADAYVACDAAGAVTGFAILRVFGRGVVLGPVCAPDAQAAKALIEHVAAKRSGQFLRIDVDAAHGLGPWLETLGLVHAGGGVSMQNGPAEPVPPRFALCSQALG